MKASPVRPGDFIEFFAEIHLSVALSACPVGTVAPVTPTTLPNAIRSRSRSIGRARARWSAGSHHRRANILARTEAGEAATPTKQQGSDSGRVSRAPPELSGAHNCRRDEGGPFEFGDQEPISSHRKLLRAKAVVVSVAETPEDFGRHGRERRAQTNRFRSVESGLDDVRTGG
jgi:hypothetical protein